MSSVHRTPKNFDGPGVTSRHIRDLLPVVLKDIGQSYHDRGDLIIVAWREIIGPQLADMTRAVSFEGGVLVVLVRNSTLFSLLNQYDKPRILKSLREKFPSTQIHNILFRIG